MTIAKALGCASLTNVREKNDFYPTHPSAVRALIDQTPALSGKPRIWEPFCGDGAISEVLLSQGFHVISTDLVNRNYGACGINFFNTECPNADTIVSNPPFSCAREVIRHALFNIKIDRLILLLKADFFNSKKSADLFYEHPPMSRYDLSWRLDFTGQGRPVMNCSWFVWSKNPNNSFMINNLVLRKPQ